MVNVTKWQQNASSRFVDLLTENFGSSFHQRSLALPDTDLDALVVGGVLTFDARHFNGQAVEFQAIFFPEETIDQSFSLYITILDKSTSTNGPWLNLEEIKNKVLEEINHGWIGWNLDLHGDMVYLVFDCDKKVIGCDFSDLDDEIARIILKQNFVETFKVADKVFQALSAAVKGY